jgi:hypothetical protein
MGPQPRNPPSKDLVLAICSLRKNATNSLETGLWSLPAHDQTNPASLAMLPMKKGFSGRRSAHFKVSNNGSLPNE